MKSFILIILFTVIAYPAYGRLNTSIGAAMFYRVDKTTNAPFGFKVTGSEIVFESTMSNKKRDIMKFDVQVFVWGTMQGWAKSMHYGTVYALFPFGIGKPNLKIGQQVIPFGLLAEYDVHGQLFQHPYALTIGERIDTGISLFGIIGPLDYWYMVSNGSELFTMDKDDNKVQTFRIAHARDVPFGEIKCGLSFLRGILPEFVQNPLVMMMAVPDTFVLKNRFAIDSELFMPRVTLRGEASIGNNGISNPFSGLADEGVLSGYLEIRYSLSYDFELMAMYSHYEPLSRSSNRFVEFGPGLNLTIPDISAISLQAAALKRNLPSTSHYYFALQMRVQI